jgi:DNA (cytosine-5)-methyltransferase 1
MVYYNEFDPYAAQWLRNLMKAGLIPEGYIDERSIQKVKALDLKGYTQCHFFAGIGGWSYALRLAGWSDETPIWTGSCPCQPFSTAGKKLGIKDERHLWPIWFDLIRECKPAIVVGEQVKNAISKHWLDLVFTDLEGEGYACGAAVLPACGVGAPHQRDRLYWMADSNWQSSKSSQRGDSRAGTTTENSTRRHTDWLLGSGSPTDSVGNTDRLQHKSNARSTTEEESRTGGARNNAAGINVGGGSPTYELGNSELHGQPAINKFAKSEEEGRLLQSKGSSSADNLANSDHGRCGQCDSEERIQLSNQNGATAGYWRDVEWLSCRDGKARPTESIPCEMVDGLPPGLGLVRNGNRFTVSPLIQETKNRVGRLRGYGNAICVPLAVKFIEACL